MRRAARFLVTVILVRWLAHRLTRRLADGEHGDVTVLEGM